MPNLDRAIMVPITISPDTIIYYDSLRYVHLINAAKNNLLQDSSDSAIIRLSSVFQIERFTNNNNVIDVTSFPDTALRTFVDTFTIFSNLTWYYKYYNCCYLWFSIDSFEAHQPLIHWTKEAEGKYTNCEKWEPLFKDTIDNALIYFFYSHTMNFPSKKEEEVSIVAFDPLRGVMSRRYILTGVTINSISLKKEREKASK